MSGMLLLVLVLVGMAGTAQAAIECPATLPGPHDRFELVGTVPAKVAVLDGLRLFDGQRGEENKTAPVELAPDSATNKAGGFATKWILGGDETVLMLCTYLGTNAYYRADIRPVPRVCTLTTGASKVTASCN